MREPTPAVRTWTKERGGGFGSPVPYGCGLPDFRLNLPNRGGGRGCGTHGPDVNGAGESVTDNYSDRAYVLWSLRPLQDAIELAGLRS